MVSIQALATGLEGGLRTGMGFYWRATGILGRELYYFEPAEARYTEEMYTGPLDPGGFLLNTPGPAGTASSAKRSSSWNRRRSVPRRAGSTDAQVAGINGFAKTMIGHQALLNLNYLGDNGIKIDFSGDLETAPFVSPAEAYEEINRYLDEGIADLANAGDAFPFSLSSGFEGFDTPASFATFNQAVQARVEIYRENADAALTALAASFVDADAPMDLGVYYTYSANSGDQLNPMFEVPTAPSVKLQGPPGFRRLRPKKATSGLSPKSWTARVMRALARARPSRTGFRAHSYPPSPVVREAPRIPSSAMRNSSSSVPKRTSSTMTSTRPRPTSTLSAMRPVSAMSNSRPTTLSSSSSTSGSIRSLLRGTAG